MIFWVRMFRLEKILQVSRLQVFLKDLHCIYVEKKLTLKTGLRCFPAIFIRIFNVFFLSF